MIYGGFETIIHTLPDNNRGVINIEISYGSCWALGVVIREAGEIIYESHPGRNIRFREADGKIAPVPGESMQKSQADWERNKYSIYADMLLGAIFFVVGKLTGDLSLAAIIGASAGLLLVVLQRFVAVDLLGGFAIFGTIMLLISASFSLAFQDDYWVQMKSTVLGLLTACVFMIDGLFRNGAYFGARIERYMPSPLHHGRVAIGMSVAGIGMAVANYFVANYFSEDFWLTYTTFLDLPLGIACFYAVFFWARKQPHNAV